MTTKPEVKLWSKEGNGGKVTQTVSDFKGETCFGSVKGKRIPVK